MRRRKGDRGREKEANDETLFKRNESSCLVTVSDYLELHNTCSVRSEPNSAILQLHIIVLKDLQGLHDMFYSCLLFALKCVQSQTAFDLLQNKLIQRQSF